MIFNLMLASIAQNIGYVYRAQEIFSSLGLTAAVEYILVLN